MHCFNLTVRYAVLPKQGALYPECAHYRLNWAEKGVLELLNQCAQGQGVQQVASVRSTTTGVRQWRCRVLHPTPPPPRVVTPLRILAADCRTSTCYPS